MFHGWEEWMPHGNLKRGVWQRAGMDVLAFRYSTGSKHPLLSIPTPQPKLLFLFASLLPTLPQFANEFQPWRPNSCISDGGGKPRGWEKENIYLHTGTTILCPTPCCKWLLQSLRNRARNCFSGQMPFENKWAPIPLPQNWGNGRWMLMKPVWKWGGVEYLHQCHASQHFTAIHGDTSPFCS